MSVYDHVQNLNCDLDRIKMPLFFKRIIKPNVRLF